MKNDSRFFWGVLLLLVGLLFLADTTGFFRYVNFNAWYIIGTFWPLILVFLGIRVLLNNNITAATVLIVLGLVFLLTNLFNWNFFALLWPLLIIAIGLSILFKKESPRVNSGSVYSEEDVVNETIVFWGVDKVVSSKNFKGGEIDVAFGGCKLDLRDAKISKDGARLNVNAAFGGVEILVPKNCRVVTNGTGFLGGWSPQVKPSEVTEPVLEITGVAAFGGVEIKE